MKVLLLFAILGLALCLNQTNKTVPHPTRRTNPSLSDILNGGAKALGGLNHQQGGSQGGNNGEELFDLSELIVKHNRTMPRRPTLNPSSGSQSGSSQGSNNGEEFFEVSRLNHTTNKTVHHVVSHPVRRTNPNSKLSDILNSGAKALQGLMNHNQGGTQGASQGSSQGSNGEELFDISELIVNHTNRTLHRTPRPSFNPSSGSQGGSQGGSGSNGEELFDLSELIVKHNRTMPRRPTLNPSSGSQSGSSQGSNNGEEFFDLSELVVNHTTNKTVHHVVSHPVRKTKTNPNVDSIISNGAKALQGLMNHNQGGASQSSNENGSNGEELFDIAELVKHFNKSETHVPKKSGSNLGELSGNGGNFLGKALNQHNNEEQF